MSAPSTGLVPRPCGGTLFVGGISAHKFLASLGQTLPRPKAILCISSHWETSDPCLTATRNPETLSEHAGLVSPAQTAYDCPGDPLLARQAAECLRVAGLKVNLNHTRGIDYAVWEPLRFMCPSADVPVVALSVQPSKPAAYHYQVGQALAPLTQQGYLIVGSGLAVRNLRYAAAKADGAGNTPIWAQAFDDWLRAALLEGRYQDVVEYRTKAPFANVAHPTPEHLLPLIVALGAAGPAARTHALNTGFGFSSISQACFYFQCQSDSLEPDPLGVNSLPLSLGVNSLSRLASAGFSKRGVPVHRTKTRRKTLASTRPPQLVVSKAHIEALQRCVLEQNRGPNPGQKSPLEERLESVLAAKQTPQLDSLTRSVSLVKKPSNQGLAESSHSFNRQQRLLDSIRAQRPGLDGSSSAVGLEFRQGGSLEEALSREGPIRGLTFPPQKVAAWVDAPQSLAPTELGLVGPPSSEENGFFHRGGGFPLHTRSHSLPTDTESKGLLRILEALFNEPGNGHLSPSKPPVLGIINQRLALHGQPRTVRSDVLQPADTPRLEVETSAASQTDEFSMEHLFDSGSAMGGGVGVPNCPPRERTSALGKMFLDRGLRSEILGKAESRAEEGAFAPGMLSNDPGPTFRGQGSSWETQTPGFGGFDLPPTGHGQVLERLPLGHASEPVESTAHLFGSGDALLVMEAGGGNEDHVAEQDYAADAMLAGMSLPDWWMWNDGPQDRQEMRSQDELMPKASSVEGGDCYPISAAHESAADAMLAGMSQPDWWSMTDLDSL